MPTIAKSHLSDTFFYQTWVRSMQCIDNPGHWLAHKSIFCILNLVWMLIFGWCLLEILKMIIDQDSCPMLFFFSGGHTLFTVFSHEEWMSLAFSSWPPGKGWRFLVFRWRQPHALLLHAVLVHRHFVAPDFPVSKVVVPKWCVPPLSLKAGAAI